MAQAPATVLQEINALYVALYGRAADGPGIAYWISTLSAHDPAITAQNAATTTISAADATFLGQQFVISQTTYFNSLYSGLTDVQFIEALYKNIGGNAGDAGGIQYWLAQLTAAEAGGATQLNARAGIVGQFVDGILSIDLTNEAATGLSPADYNAAVARQNQLMNRVTVSQFYADQSNINAAAGTLLDVTAIPSNQFTAASDAVNSVTNDNATVGLAKTAISSAVASASLQPIFNLLVPAFKQTFTLTVSQDILTTGTGNDLFLAPLDGIFGFQPTLTPFDTLIDAGNNNALSAFFNGGFGATVGGLTIQGIQTWNFSNAISATTTITGVAFGLGGPGPNGLPNNPGVQTINFQYSGNGGAQTLTVGSPGAGGGIQSLLTGTAAAPAIVVRNNLGTSTVNVFVGANQWAGVANSTLVVATNSGSTTFDVGPDVATAGAGYVNWVVQDWDAHSAATDTLTLGAQGNATGVAHTLTVTGANGGAELANVTLVDVTGGGPAFSGLTSVDGHLVSGFFTVTGAETANGILSGDTTALTSIIGGTGGSSFDLSAMTNAAVHAMTTINGGSGLGFVEFNNGVISAAFTTPVALVNIDDISDSTGATGNITIDMRNFPLVTGAATFNGISFAELQFLSAASATTGVTLGTLNIINGLTDLFVQFNEQSFGALVNSITITAGLANLNGGNDAVAVGLSDVGSPTSVTLNNYTGVELVLASTGGTVFGSGLTTFVDNPVIGTVGATINIYDAGVAADTFYFGKVIDGSLSTADFGVSTVSITAPIPLTINDNSAGWLNLGATNANMINAQSSSHFTVDVAPTGGGVNPTFINDAAGGTGVVGVPFPENPILNYGVTENGSVNGASLLEGSTGTIALDTALNAYLGGIQADTLNANSPTGGDIVFGLGGNDAVNLAAHTGVDTVEIGVYSLGNTGVASFLNFNQAITDVVAGAEIGVNGYLGTLSNVTTVTGFHIGATGDHLDFASADWVGTAGAVLITGGADFGLWNGNLSAAVPVGGAASTMLLVTAPATVLGTETVTLDGIGIYASASVLQAQLKVAGVGDLNLGAAGLAAGNLIHELVAYNTGTSINIADLSIYNTGGANVTDTAAANATISVHDLVHITGTYNLADMNPANITFVA